MQAKHKTAVIQAPSVKPARQAQHQEPIEETYRELFHEQVSPLWLDDDSEYSLEQPSPVRFVPSVTTYGISEAPIVR